MNCIMCNSSSQSRLCYDVEWNNVQQCPIYRIALSPRFICTIFNEINNQRVIGVTYYSLIVYLIEYRTNETWGLTDVFVDYLIRLYRFLLDIARGMPNVQ